MDSNDNELTWNDVKLVIRGKEIEGMEGISFFSDNQGVVTKLIRKAVEMEEKIIKDVLRQFLKREPTIEDAKKCKKVFYSGDNTTYEFIFEDVILGNIRKDNYGFGFTPDKQFK